MKKFSSGDIIYNSIKTYPKVRFFVNSGSISYNNDTNSSGAAVLFDFLRNPPSFITPEECFLLAEDGQTLLSENNVELQPEYCETITTFNILSEASEFLLSEDTQEVVIEESL